MFRQVHNKNMEHLEMQRFRKLIWLAGLLMLAGCTSIGINKKPEPLAVYDIEPQGVEPVRVSIPITDMEVLAPSWLSSSAMQYRYAANALERRTYANSRWVGIPAEMVQLVIERVVKTRPAPDGSGCRLRIDLDEFIQRFTNAQASVGHVELRGSLLAPRTEALVAEKIFTVEVPAPSADAEGGVVALRSGVNQVAVEVAQWLQALGSERGKRSIVSRCDG